MSREIARLDENGVIVAVEPVNDAEYRTDPIARTVQLEPTHDMHNHLRQYRFNWHSGVFMPLSQAAIDVDDRDTDGELVEGVIDAVEDMADFLSEQVNRKGRTFQLSERAGRVIRQYRRKRPRKKKRQDMPEAEAPTTVTVDADVRVRAGGGPA